MNDKIRKLEMPLGSREVPRLCFFGVVVPVQDSRGAITGASLMRGPCDEKCALFDREKNRPCLTAMREDLVAAIQGMVSVTQAVSQASR